MINPDLISKEDAAEIIASVSYTHLAFLHTFDILEGSAVRHDNKSDNTQCMKIDRRRTHG